MAAIKLTGKKPQTVAEKAAQLKAAKASALKRKGRGRSAVDDLRKEGVVSIARKRAAAARKLRAGKPVGDGRTQTVDDDNSDKISLGKKKSKSKGKGKKGSEEKAKIKAIDLSKSSSRLPDSPYARGGVGKKAAPKKRISSKK